MKHPYISFFKYSSTYLKKYKWGLLTLCLLQARSELLIGQATHGPALIESQIEALPDKTNPFRIDQETVMNLVIENSLTIPERSFTLSQNTPNPFSKETYIRFEMLQESDVTLTVYGPKGQVMKSYEGHFKKGKNQILVNGKDLRTYGILYYQMTTPDQILSKKMIFREEREGEKVKD